MQEVVGSSPIISKNKKNFRNKPESFFYFQKPPDFFLSSFVSMEYAVGMQQSNDVSFFDENEKRINKTTGIILNWTILSGPALILARFFKLFSEVGYVHLVIYTLLLALLAVCINIAVKKNSGNKLIKYFCVGIVEALICYLAMTHGLCLFLSYLIAPIFSCLYYDRRFTRNVIIVCFFLMFGTLVYRGFIPSSIYVNNMSPAVYIAAYGTGISIEYIICSMIIMYVVRSARETLDAQCREEDEVRQRQKELAEKNHRIQSMQDHLISSFANLVESRDTTTGEHVRRTQAYVLVLCGQLKALGYYTAYLSPKMMECMVSAASLHDLGKIRIPDSILCKPGKLTKDEFEIIKKHSVYGERLINENVAGVEDAQFTKTACEMAHYHHEWWNGKGYPEGLAENKIPLCARIMAVADVFDALISKRPYKDRIPPDVAFDIIEQLSGQQFDPHVVEALMACKEEIKRIS